MLFTGVSKCSLEITPSPVSARVPRINSGRDVMGEFKGNKA